MVGFYKGPSVMFLMFSTIGGVEMGWKDTEI